jgi:hypothetical protein
VKTFGKEGELISDETASPMNGPGTITGGTVCRFPFRLIQYAVDLDGFPYFRQAPKDTDGDGIPDSYETAHGLNPNVNDAMTIASNGYASKDRLVDLVF